LPAFQRCPVLNRITSHWVQWIQGESLDDVSDFFWGL
jgi:hypothetical protein